MFRTNGSRSLLAATDGGEGDEVYIMYYLIYLFISEIAADYEQYVIVCILFFIFFLSLLFCIVSSEYTRATTLQDNIYRYHIICVLFQKRRRLELGGYIIMCICVLCTGGGAHNIIIIQLQTEFA